MKSFSLTPTQIRTLAELTTRFKEVESFEILLNNSTGIGPTTTVSFQMSGNEVTVDITDVSSW